NAISAVGITDVYRRHIAKNRDERHYMRAAQAVSLAASLAMLGGAALLMASQTLTLQDTSTKLAAVFAGGLLGLYCLGFLTRRGDGRAVAVGIVCTLVFTAWMISKDAGFISEARFMALGIPAGLAKYLALPMDTY